MNKIEKDIYDLIQKSLHPKTTSAAIAEAIAKLVQEKYIEPAFDAGYNRALESVGYDFELSEPLNKNEWLKENIG